MLVSRFLLREHFLYLFLDILLEVKVFGVHFNELVSWHHLVRLKDKDVDLVDISWQLSTHMIYVSAVETRTWVRILVFQVTYVAFATGFQILRKKLFPPCPTRYAKKVKLDFLCPQKRLLLLEAWIQTAWTTHQLLSPLRSLLHVHLLVLRLKFSHFNMLLQPILCHEREVS